MEKWKNKTKQVGDPSALASLPSPILTPPKRVFLEMTYEMIISKILWLKN